MAVIVVDDEEWQVLPNDWWRISFTTVSWKDHRKKDEQSFRVYARPPHYHDSLFFHGSVDSLADPGEGDDLNSDLIGVRAAEAVIGVYERDVGFQVDDIAQPPKVPDLTVDVSDDTVAVHKERWDQFMSDLMAPLDNNRDLSFTDDWSPDSSPSGSSRSWFCSGGLSSSVSTLSSFDLLSIGNSLSMPSTPKPKISYANVVIQHETRSCNPSPVGGSPSRRPAASCVPSSPKPIEISFPTISASPPPMTPQYPSFTNFTFPSLTVPPVPTVKIHKDEQGFYSGVEETPSSRPSVTLLPPFLHDSSQRRKVFSSKTRSIVDGLRKADVSQVRESVSHSPSPSPPFAEDGGFFKPRLSVSEDGGDREASSHSIETDADGWIGLSEQTKQEVLNTAKARRTRDLFRALRRHRSDSTPSDSSKDSRPASDESQDGSTSSLPALSSSSTSPSPSSSAQSSNDGWIEGVVLSPPKVKTRKRQPSHPRSKRKSQSISSFHNALPPPPASSYSAIHRFPPVSTQAGMFPPPPPVAPPYYLAHYHIPTVPMHPPYGYMQVPMQYQLHPHHIHPHMHGAHLRQASSHLRPPVP